MDHGNSKENHTKQIAKNERRIAELDKLFGDLYEDKSKGILSEERFVQMSAKFEQEQAELKTKNTALQSEIDAWDADSERADKFIELVRRYTRFDELTTPMINEFVDRIVIHEGVWSEQGNPNGYKGTRTQKIDVYLKYVGKFDAPDARTPEEFEAERVAEEKREKLRTQKREYERKRRERIRATNANQTA